MALDNFIPTVWSAALLRELEKNLVFAQITNRDIEGEVKFGSTVKVNVAGPISVVDYTKYTDIPVQQVSTTAKTFLIDQSKAFAFEVDDVDAAQARADTMVAFMQEAAYAVRDAVDQYIAGLWTGVDAGNVLGSDASPQTLSTGAQAYDLLVTLGRILTDAKVPRAGRFVVMSPTFEALLFRSDSPLAKVDTAARQALLNGQVAGPLAGFDFPLVSHNLPTDGNGNDIIIAGVKTAWAFAMQVEKVEAVRPPFRFTDLVKGLTVYGGKLIFPTRLAVAHVAYA